MEQKSIPFGERVARIARDPEAFSIAVSLTFYEGENHQTSFVRSIFLMGGYFAPLTDSIDLLLKVLLRGGWVIIHPKQQPKCGDIYLTANENGEWEQIGFVAKTQKEGNNRFLSLSFSGASMKEFSGVYVWLRLEGT